MVAGAGSMLVLQAYIAVKIVARIRIDQTRSTVFLLKRFCDFVSIVPLLFTFTHSLPKALRNCKLLIS